MRTLNIGMASAASGVHPKMIRYYEQAGLLPKVRRTDAGYRLYGPEDVETLRLIRRGRDLGLSLAEVRTLIQLWRNRERPSRQVKALIDHRIDLLDREIQELGALRKILSDLSGACRGDERPECPILEDFVRAGELSRDFQQRRYG